MVLRCFLLHGMGPWAMEDGLAMVLAKRVSWKLCIPKTYTHTHNIHIYIMQSYILYIIYKYACWAVCALYVIVKTFTTNF